MFRRNDGILRVRRLRPRLSGARAVFVAVCAFLSWPLILLPYLSDTLLLSFEPVLGLQPLRILALVPGLAALAAAFRRRPAAVWIAAALVEALAALECIENVPVFPHRAPPGGGGVRVFTQNTNQGDAAPWLDWLEQNRVDLACFQEIYACKRKEWEAGAKRLGYQTHYTELRKDSGMGSLVLARGKITVLPAVSLLSRGGATRWIPHLRVRFGNTGPAVDVFSVHMESAPRKLGLAAFVASWELRREQCLKLAGQVRRCRGPVIVAGDFNATPTDRSIRPLRGLLQDAWSLAGNGWLGGTWPASRPLLRIDAVRFRGFEGARSAAVAPTVWSDHCGVVAELALPSRAKD